MHVDKYDPTIADSYQRQCIIDNQLYSISVFDGVGQEEYTALRNQWIKDADAFMLVYSIASRSSFDQIRHFRNRVFRVKGGKEAPMIIVGNKCRSNAGGRVVSPLDAVLWLDEISLEVDGESGYNVTEAFVELVRDPRFLGDNTSAAVPESARLRRRTLYCIEQKLRDVERLIHEKREKTERVEEEGKLLRLEEDRQELIAILRNHRENDLRKSLEENDEKFERMLPKLNKPAHSAS
jgi:GTPase SAR1 family protein